MSAQRMQTDRPLASPGISQLGEVMALEVGHWMQVALTFPETQGSAWQMKMPAVWKIVPPSRELQHYQNAQTSSSQV